MQNEIKTLWQCLTHQNRIKSLLYRALAFAAVAAISSIQTDLTHIVFNPAVVAFVGLVAGEAMKALNNWISQNPLPQA